MLCALCSVLFLSVCGYGQTFAGNTNAEKELVTQLLKDYDPTIRPVRNSSDAVKLSLVLYLNMIEDLNEKSQVLTASVWFQRLWTDEFLQWEPSDFGGLTQVILPPTKIWTPDVGLFNSVGNVYGPLIDPDYQLVVSNNGSVGWIVANSVSLGCLLDLTYLPFDNQTCEFEFLPWVYHRGQMDIVDGKVYHYNFRSHVEWEIIHYETNVSSISFDALEYSQFKVYLHLKRKPGYIMNTIVAPAVILLSLCSLLFILPSDTGEKATLGITVLLSFSVLLLVVAEDIPRTSEIPLLSHFLMMAMVLAAMSLACTVGVLNVEYRSYPLPSWLRKLVDSCLGKVMCYGTEQAVDCRERETSTSSISKSPVESPPPSSKQVLYDSSTGTGTAKEAMPPDPTNTMYQSANDDSPCNALLLGTLREMRGELRALAGTRLDAKREAVNRESWQQVASFLNRAFFALFVVASIVLCVVMLEVIPSDKDD